MRIDTNEINAFPLFKGIRKTDLDLMLQCLGVHSSNYEKGEYIYLTDNELNCIGLVCSGSIHMIKEDIWGNRSIFTIIPRGDVFGETFICSRLFAANVSFCAAEKCIIMFLPFSRVLHSCAKSCEFHNCLVENMMGLIAFKNIQFIQKLEITSKKTIREKILTYISQQVQAHGKPYITSPMGRLELADYLCVDRSALTRELSNMKRDGILDYDKNTFRLLKEK